MGTLKAIETKENERVKVVVRCRPMNIKEVKSGYCKVVDVLPSTGSIKIYNPKENDSEGKTFTFDAVYDWDSSQEDLYEESVQPVVNSVLNGFNGTIFAYGQTGTGKTFTMEGDQLNPLAKGVIQKSFEQIFSHILQSKNTQYLVRASYIEIYQEEVKDLLDGNNNISYELRGNGSVFIKNLKSRVCKTVKEMEEVMISGNKNRKTGATNMNDHSSRSHAIFVITVEMSKTVSGINQVRVGKLNLVDLAGSERQSKSCASGERLKEASKINLSLSALGNVISALSTNKKFHVPYRDSKLTRFLQDSLGGNSKTLMIANIGPASYNYDESLTTLRYANRAKNIKNKPRINEDQKDALIREYQTEIKRLKVLLQFKLNKNTKLGLLDYNSNDKIKYITENRAFIDKNTHYKVLKEYKQSIERESFCNEDKTTGINKETEKKTNILSAERHYIEELKAKIELMESRILFGKNFVEYTNEQEKTLQKQAAEMIERNKYKKELKKQLDHEEETTEELHETNMNLHQEVERMIKKLKKTSSKLQVIKKQTADLIEEFNTDRRDLEMAHYDLMKEYKLNNLVIENFIPTDEKQKYLDNLCYNEETGKWTNNNKITNNIIIGRANASPNKRRSETVYCRVLGKLEKSARYKKENVINLTPEQFLKKTKVYISPEVAPAVKCVIEAALKAEDDITVDAMSLITNCPIKTANIKSILKEACRNEFKNKMSIYPEVRGLVKK